MGYFEARKARYNRIRSHILNIAKELVSEGYDVYHKDEMLLIIKDNKHLWMGFSEVPYRFYMNYSITPSRGTGSSVSISEREGSEPEHCYSLEEIKSNVIHNCPKVYGKDLWVWHSWLEKINLDMSE